MGEIYGVTPKGFMLRRFDTIYALMAERIKNYAGIDITSNPNSVLNLAICYPACDIAAQLHEENLEIYHSLHPSSAEGVALDDSCQFGNIKRISARKTTYQISCNTTDGSTVKKNTIIAADTNPRHDLYCDSDTVVSREAFNEAYIRTVTANVGEVYTVTIDDVKYSYTAVSSDEDVILTAIQGLIGDGYETDMVDGILAIKSKVPDEVHILELSPNLTTDSITGLVPFSTEEYGMVVMPTRTITMIISNLSTGFNWCENRINPEVGRDAEEDWEYRQSYIKRIYSSSSNQKESVKSYLLNNVNGIESCQIYENYGDEIDSGGRLPHSIEAVVSGGKDADIAYAILRSKAGGIQTNGSVIVECTGINDEPIEVRFNRPSNVYAWIRIELHGNSSEIPKDYAKIVTDICMDTYDGAAAGTSLILQKIVGSIYEKVAGIKYAYISQYHSTDSTDKPALSQYSQSNITALAREIVMVSEDRIEVVVSENI